MKRFDLKFSLIPYASVTTDMVNNSTNASKDKMTRAVRGEDNVIVVYKSANRSTYSAYIEYDFATKFQNIVKTPNFDKDLNNKTIDFIEVKGDIKDATSSEIYDIEITTAGTGYSAGTLTATGGGGSGFSGTYAVTIGTVSKINILNMGSGYTSTPTIVISDSGNGDAVLTPRLREESSEDNTRVLDISLKDDLTYASTLTIDKNSTATASETTKGLSIDFDHTGIAASGQTINNQGLDLSVNSSSPTMVGTVNNTGIQLACQGGTSGTQTNIGIDLRTYNADTNDGIHINCTDTHLKLMAGADSTNDYATLSVANTGDLTIATVGDGTTDSDLTLDADGKVILDAATARTVEVAVAGTSWATFTPVGRKFQINSAADANDYCRFAVGSAGATTLTTIDDSASAADLLLDIDGDISLDSATGVFISKNNGTEFSAANSSYAGMILGYRDIGLNEGEASYNLTTSYVVPTDEFGVTFVAPPSGKVQYIIENIWLDYGSSNAGDFYAGLSTANATSGYSALASYHEKNFGDGEGRGAENVSSISWTLIGLTAGSSYTYYVGFKSSSTSGTPHMSWGGDATGKSPDIIIKAIALPETIST